MGWRVGVDIGGTFTDVALVEEASGEIGVAKVPTTPRNLAEGVLAALGMAMDRYRVKRGDVALLSHATTVVTNAILEGHGARAALVTTRGFRDVLELRRSARADLYDLFQDAPATLVPRRRRFEITERIGADGAVVTPLAEAEIDALVATLRAQRVEAVAVSLLFSFLNPAHERRLGARLRAALPDVPVYLSCEVLPEIKEFERTSTTAICAYVGPISDTWPCVAPRPVADARSARGRARSNDRSRGRPRRRAEHRSGSRGRPGSTRRRSRGRSSTWSRRPGRRRTSARPRITPAWAMRWSA